MRKSALLALLPGILLLASTAPLLAQSALPAPSPLRLPFATVFKGESKFQALVQQAERENWRALPLGARTIRAARAMVGTPYVNYSLEVDDHIESPVVNLTAMDCWTYYENALAFARMLRYKPAPYIPQDLIYMVEVERYRNGQCTGQYLSRMHQLEEVFYNNEQRGLAQNITPRLPGAEKLEREIHEMTVQWKDYRYLRNNPALLPDMARIEAAVSKLPVAYIPKAKVRAVEPYLQDGDVCAITSNDKDSYTCHVGMIVRLNDRAYFTHATSDHDKGRMTIIDCPITDYLNQMAKHTGIVILRPKDVPPSPLWQKNMVGR